LNLPHTINSNIQSWLTHQEAELLLAEVDLDPEEENVEEIVDVDVEEDVGLVAEQTRTRRRNGNLSPSLVVL
jgi:hypothetical protein